MTRLPRGQDDTRASLTRRKVRSSTPPFEKVRSSGLADASNAPTSENEPSRGEAIGSSPVGLEESVFAVRARDEKPGFVRQAGTSL